MCRLLFVKSETEFLIKEHLLPFSSIAKSSKEYQGHGWGCSYLVDEKWKHYKNIKPIWEDDISRFGKTDRLIVHARSAFQDKDVFVENNMPFYDDKYIFIFNGELQGVKLKAKGRIGAEKIFNFIKRFDKGNMKTALQKSLKIINIRSKYVRAMNIIITDKQNTYISSTYNEDPDYFSMSYKKDNNSTVICSQAYPGETNWTKIENNSVGVY